MGLWEGVRCAGGWDKRDMDRVRWVRDGCENVLTLDLRGSVNLGGLSCSRL